MRLLEHKPAASQRELAAELGISLGKTNYCLRALVERGLVKARNFRNSSNKRAYAYFLTPQGIVEKGRVTVRLLARKKREYAALQAEIADLQRAYGATADDTTPVGAASAANSPAEPTGHDP